MEGIYTGLPTARADKYIGAAMRVVWVLPKPIYITAGADPGFVEGGGGGAAATASATGAKVFGGSLRRQYNTIQ